MAPLLSSATHVADVPLRPTDSNASVGFVKLGFRVRAPMQAAPAAQAASQQQQQPAAAAAGGGRGGGKASGASRAAVEEEDDMDFANRLVSHLLTPSGASAAPYE